MLARFSVKKPYTVIVGVLLVIILGVISFMNMTTDLLPSMNFPYVIVYTTYIGATPEQVETDVTRPMESSFATLTNIKNITSTSSDNVSMVMLEFNDTADMNTAMIEINSEITTLSNGWSDSVGAPVIMKINPDMLPVQIVSVAQEGMDILELSEYVEDTLIPEYEALNGVASATASGLVTQEIDITIEQDRIDILNNAILADIDAELADAEKQLDDAQDQISDGRSELARQKKSVMAQINSGLESLESGEEQLEAAKSELTAQRAELVTQLEQVNDAIEQLEQVNNMTDAERALLKELTDQLGNLRAQKEQLEAELDKLENGEGEGNEAIAQQKADAEARKAELVAERAGYEAYIADLESADPEALKTEIASLTEQQTAAQSALDAANAVLTEKTAERDATAAHISELEESLAGLENTPAPTETAAATATPTVTESPSAEPTVEASEMPVVSDPPSVTEDPSAEPTAEATAAPTAEATAEATVEPTADLTVEATAEATSEPTAAPTSTPSVQSFLEWMFSAGADEVSADELKAEIAAAKETLAAQEEAVTAAQADVDAKSAALNDVTAQLEDKQSALADIENGTVESRINAAEREIAVLDLRIAAVDEEIKQLDNLVSGGSEAINNLRSMLDTLDTAIAEIEESETYQGLLLILDDEKRAEQYAAALSGKAQLEAGIAQIDSVLEKLNEGVIPGGLIEGIDEDTSLADARSQLESAKKQASSGFSDAEDQLDAAATELATARKEFETARDEALENAGLDGVITMETVAGIIGAQNFSMPAGYVYDLAEDEYLVRVGDKFVSLDDLKNLKLFSVGTDSVDDVRLLDVARVELVDNRAENFTKVDGQDGIMLSIEKQSTFSTTDVAERVAEKTEQLVAENDGLTIVSLFNQGDYINIIVDSVLDNLVSGGILAVLVLLIFLMDWRPTLIVALSIPLSVVTAFVCMYFSGITLNVLSLSGLALGIGMLVDNSIVAIENIYRLHNEEHMPVLRACVEGIRQIGGALFSSTLTTISVFLPVVFVTGLAHDLFLDMGLTIAYSLLASLLVAMTLVPSMAAALIRPRKKGKKPRRDHFAPVQNGYVKLLKGTLRVKPLVLLVAVALLVVSVMQIPKMGMSFMPEVSSDQMTATLALDPEGDIPAQQDEAVEMMNRMMEIDGINTIGLTGGGSMSALSGGGGSALTYYIIVDAEAGRSNADIAKDIRKLADDMTMELSVSTSTMDISMLTGSGISINITGSELDTLRAIAADVAEIVSGIDGAIEINDGMEDSVPEIRIIVDKEKAIDKGLTVAQVLQYVATKLAGKTEITEVTLDGRSMSVYMIDGRNSGITPENLEDLEIETATADGTEMVRIGDIASISETESLTSINRSAQQRVVTVSFQVAEGYNMNHVNEDLVAALDGYTPPEGYNVALSGENEMVTSIMGDLVFMVGIAIVLIFLIMVAQFQSFKSPIIVLFTIPLAFTGGLIALQLTGMDLSIVAMVGFLVLSGVIVNNGIVFVDSVNQMRIGGMSKRDALLETGRIRLRPILMTALTTILGMSTMAMATGMGAEMMQPMAVVSIGGLTYATLMTLFVVPALYDIFNGEKMTSREIEMIKESAGIERDMFAEDKAEEETAEAAPAAEPAPVPETPAEEPVRGKHSPKEAPVAEAAAVAAEAAAEPAPAQSAAPVQPTVTEQPSAPVQPAATAQPAAPVQSTAPAQPAAPVQSAVTTQPSAPVQTAAPAQTVPPAQPGYAPNPYGYAPYYPPYPQQAPYGYPAYPAPDAQQAQPQQPVYPAQPQYPPYGYPQQPYYPPQVPYGYPAYPYPPQQQPAQAPAQGNPPVNQ